MMYFRDLLSRYDNHYDKTMALATSPMDLVDVYIGSPWLRFPGFLLAIVASLVLMILLLVPGLIWWAWDSAWEDR